MLISQLAAISLLFFPQDLIAVGSVNPYNKSFIGQACSVKMELSCPLEIARYPRAIIHSKST